jgi:hypothetical protein
MLLIALLLALPRPVSAQTAEQAWSAGVVAFDGAKFQFTAPRPAPVPTGAVAAAPRLTLSQLARELQNEPGAIEDLVDRLAQAAGQLGRAADTPAARAKLADALRRADPAVLDRFPVLTASQAAEGAALYASRQGVLPEPVYPAETVFAPTHAPALPPKDNDVTPLGHGLLRGDDSLAVPGANWADARSVSDALNLLAMNDGASAARSLVDGGTRYADVGGWLGALLAQGHSIAVRDRRYYANFGHLRFEKDGVRSDVTTPTRLDTGLTLKTGRRVIVPVAHSEIDVAIRGPRVNAEISFYFGVDGGVGFRPFDTRDMDWVGGRVVRAWSGADAAKLLDRAGWIRRELMAKAKQFGLPMGGYGPLGDCNDADAMLTGDAPYGMLRDPKYYSGSSDIDALSRALPYDLTAPPTLRRVFNSRPFSDLDRIQMPDVRATMKELARELPSDGVL